jgi:hypothetical protein
MNAVAVKRCRWCNAPATTDRMISPARRGKDGRVLELEIRQYVCDKHAARIDRNDRANGLQKRISSLARQATRVGHRSGLRKQLLRELGDARLELADLLDIQDGSAA